MSPFISTSMACRTASCRAMSSLSSRRAPKRNLRVTAAADVLLVVVFLALFVSSCDARRLRARGKGGLIRESPPAVPCVDVANLKVDGSLTKRANGLSNADTRAAMDDQMARAYAKVEEGVAAAAPSAGAVRSTIVARVSQRISADPKQREGTGFHLDYAGPRTHTPSHN